MNMTQPKLLVYAINSSAVLKIFERARDGEGQEADGALLGLRNSHRQ